MSIKITINNVNCKIQGATLPVLAQLTQALSVKVPNYYFATAYKMGKWDGYQRFLNRPANTFPTGLLPQVLDLLENDLELEVELDDNRTCVNEYLMTQVSDDYHVSEAKKARDYQVDTINKVIDNNLHGIPFTRGVINIATNGGKTVIAEGIIKQLYPKLIDNNSNFLFVTHSKEIARQARLSISKDLKIPVGMIGDGEWLVKPVTVAIITTLFRRMKDRKPEWFELRPNIIGFVGDECLSYNTTVLLPDLTYKSIQDVCEDESIQEVMSYNVQTGEMEPKKILRKIVNKHDGTFHIMYPAYHPGLVATKNHKIYTKNRGYVRLDQLSSDDVLLIWSHDQVHETHLAGEIDQWTYTNPNYLNRYNLEVADNHNYFANGILVSNCHHSSADSWYTVFNEMCNASIRLGLTGTIDKSKPVQEMKLYACTGSVLNRVSNEYLIQNGYSSKPQCILFKVNSPELGDLDYPNAYQFGVVENEERNDVILNIVDKETNSNNKVLILVEHIEHGEILEDKLANLNKQVYFTNGQLSSVMREELLERLRNGTLDVLIASNILDEGIDVSGINAIIYARGMKSMRKLLQGIGRGLRVKADGSRLRFYDFIDDTHMTLLKHSSDRYKTLRDERFDVVLLSVEKYKNMIWEDINGGSED